MRRTQHHPRPADLDSDPDSLALLIPRCLAETRERRKERKEQTQQKPDAAPPSQHLWRRRRAHSRAAIPPRWARPQSRPAPVPGAERQERLPRAPRGGQPVKEAKSWRARLGRRGAGGRRPPSGQQGPPQPCLDPPRGQREATGTSHRAVS